MEAIAFNFFNWEIMQASLPTLLRGLGMTLLLLLVVIPLGAIGGLVVALLSLSRHRSLRWPMVVYVDLFRATPPLVLLIFLHAGLPFAGIQLTAFGAVALTFLLNTSSFYGEILRAGIESVSPGQSAAARSTGVGAVDTMFFVVLPQAVRNVLPDLVSNTLEVAKLTAIASVVALPELLYAADMMRSITYNSTPVVMAAVLYLILLWPLVRLLSRLEHQMMR